MRRAVAAAVLVGLAAICSSRDAGAYEFQVATRTVGQAYQLPSLRLLGADLWLARRRFTQSLTINIWDLGDLRKRRLRERPALAGAGPVVWMTAHLRLDHDFGDWTMGTLNVDDVAVDAIDAVPELAASSLGLEMLYGYVAVDGLAGVVDLRVGRQLSVDALDWWAFDGVTVRVRTPWHVAIEGQAGLRVRDGSPLGPAVIDLDGTSGADCTEYVEGPTPGTGSWQIIDRSRVPGQSALGSDLAYCPERQALTPTVGAAIETTGVRGVHARLSYRRSQSRTPGLIGAVDRLDHPDLGLYPNEHGQAPAWGVDEEHVALVGRARRRVGGVTVEPWAQARYSLLHAVVDEAGAGVRLERGAWAIEPEVARSVPTFDGDSLFNVFAVGAATDLRITADRAPRDGGARGYATGWLRRYVLPTATDEAAATDAWVAGVRAGAEADVSRRVRARLELVGDDGYGGRRTGATAIGRWQTSPKLALTARVGGFTVDTGDDTTPAVSGDGVRGVGQLGAVWRVDRGIVVHGQLEVASGPSAPAQARGLVVLDLDFEPEM